MFQTHVWLFACDGTLTYFLVESHCQSTMQGISGLAFLGSRSEVSPVAGWVGRLSLEWVSVYLTLHFYGSDELGGLHPCTVGGELINAVSEI